MALPALLHRGERNDACKQLRDHSANVGLPARVFIVWRASCTYRHHLWTPAKLLRQILVTKAFSSRKIRLSAFAISHGLLNPLGLQSIAPKFNFGLVSLLHALRSELK
jgi:hypothetical protein